MAPQIGVSVLFEKFGFVRKWNPPLPPLCDHLYGTTTCTMMYTQPVKLARKAGPGLF